MNSDELKNIIEEARINKGISQRELSKISGISRSTLNDIINGKIKKVDVDALKKIAETLDLSLEKLLKVAGYDSFLDFLSLDRYKNKSTKDLKEILEEYKKTQLDLLDFDFQKRKTARNLKSKLNTTVENLNEIKEGNPVIDEAIKDIQSAFEELKKIEEKYNYQKLPKEK